MYIVYDCFVNFSAARGPGIVIAHPGQDVELLCNVTVTSGSQTPVAWLVNQRGLYGVNALHNGLLEGHSADISNNNLIVQNIAVNDVRNNSVYRCVTLLQGTSIILNGSDTTFLYVAGKYHV